MSLLQNSNAIPQLGGYNLTDSVRFRSSASAYLTRTPSSSGNRKTWTWSGWVKRGTLSSSASYTLFGANSTYTFGFYQDKIYYDVTFSGATRIIQASNRLFRDPSAWYHIIFAVDTTQATGSDRIKIYVNNELITSYTYVVGSGYITQNTDTLVNDNAYIHSIGYRAIDNDRYFDGYMTEINFVDGQQLTPSDFGKYDATTGVWKPKEYTGTYGTNGFYLPMKATTQASGFNTVLWTGTGIPPMSISGVGFQPDLIWVKGRNSTYQHRLHDSVRGSNQYLRSHTTDAEATFSNLTIDSDGFTVDSVGSQYIGSGGNFVAWCWEAGGTASSNTDGTITSSVSANTAKGFSIVTYTGTGVAGTIGHGLGSAPEMIILKGRDANAGYDDWYVYHSSLGNGNKIFLNSTAASSATSVWDSTSPTNDVFSVRANTINTSGIAMVAYCFAEVEGFSKFGSWETVNVGGTPAAGFVYTGFRPKLIIWKAADTSSSYTSWGMQDTSRTTYNGDSETLHTLWANRNYAEGARGNGSSSGALGANGFQIDFLSNGFNIKGGGNSELASSGTYIYMAWAESPFKNSLAR